jgi:hypothetical protein
MSEARAPVRTATDLATLDSAEIVEGYMDALAGESPPGDNRSRSYWHGYENGRADRENRSRPESVELARSIRRYGLYTPESP